MTRAAIYLTLLLISGASGAEGGAWSESLVDQSAISLEQCQIEKEFNFEMPDGDTVPSQAESFHENGTPSYYEYQNSAITLCRTRTQPIRAPPGHLI